jgi:hypothetical protein
MLKIIALIGIILALCASPAQAVPAQCHAKGDKARILSAPSPTAVHPDWVGASVGTSWTFSSKKGIVKTPGMNKPGADVYLRGDLISPRGGTVTKNVFIVLDEWNCEFAD